MATTLIHQLLITFYLFVHHHVVLYYFFIRNIFSVLQIQNAFSLMFISVQLVCFILTMYHHFSWTLFRQFVLVNVIVRFGNFPLTIITDNAFRTLTLFLFCFFICHRFIQGPYQKTI